MCQSDSLLACFKISLPWLFFLQCLPPLSYQDLLYRIIPPLGVGHLTGWDRLHVLMIYVISDFSGVPLGSDFHPFSVIDTGFTQRRSLKALWRSAKGKLRLPIVLSLFSCLYDEKLPRSSCATLKLEPERARTHQLEAWHWLLNRDDAVWFKRLVCPTSVVSRKFLFRDFLFVAGSCMTLNVDAEGSG